VNFLKQNKFFVSIIILCFLVFSSLQFVSCNSEENLESLISSISSESRKTDSLKADLLLYKGLAEESSAAMEDLVTLAEVEKEQHRFWNTILNSSQNIYSDWKIKSPESINADITRLYSNLNDTCKSNNVDFEQTGNSAVNIFGNSNETPEKKYGFGLSSYDGFWPSFSKEEAQLLGIQSKIIASMVEFLAESSDSKHKITLMEILRESVGKEDSQHIASDILPVMQTRNKLIRFDERIKSFAFLIKFKSHTSHARSFINQLRPPFLLRDLQVNRSENAFVSTTGQAEPDPFTNEVQASQQPLPIVQNVESVFTLLVEYIYEIDRDFETFITGFLENEKVNIDALSKFLEISGNSKIRSKINKD